jgi:L-alanine-DL-glutamate epimerase-like enolase superfamily enzyme
LTEDRASPIGYHAAIRISRVSVFRQWQPFVDGPYTCSGNRSAEGFDSTIVKLETDAGVTGWGEMAPLGAFYDPAFAEGARAAIALLAPALIGEDPRQPARLGRRIDLLLNGHPYAKSAIDMALWDITAASAGLPLAEALGGRFGDTVDLYRSVAQDTPEAMAKAAAHYVGQGYRRIQVKVGLDPDEDVERMHAVLEVLPPGTIVFADANASWLPAEARRFLRATNRLDYTLEQPCAGYDANLAIRAACDRPLVLDETIDGLPTLLRALGDRLVDGVTIKLARVGGITKARLIRDVAVEAGLLVTVEDTGGSVIDTAAMAHLSLSTPEGSRAHTVDFHHWVTVANGTADLRCVGGTMTAPTSAGLGVDVDEAVLGSPILVAP